MVTITKNLVVIQVVFFEIKNKVICKIDYLSKFSMVLQFNLIQQVFCC